ncbi:hypothetical protein D9758_018762 [Tetrapyrgos nigripes]|uniref:Uncharacterized protein n=1 Tax=Tetrapyrgos nigripes TaxID=182062 RepID=A0A8H5F1X3_9AGAR|nr:hypothetical protein D9758_018762 [Tetrapyrgos nigripes]
MLTFFKPWRTGKDLKEKKETWDSAFLDYQFSAQQKFLMDNFELRFECLDSRDDYHAQRKAQSLGIDPSKLEPDFDDGIHFDPFKCSDDSLGVRERRRQLDMQEMTDLLANTGWTNAKYPSNESRSIDNPRFRNTSIILTYNKHKDVANELGTKRFAAETGQMLAHFFSEDEEVVFDELPSKTHDRKRKRRKATKHKINDEVQQQLWKQSPSTNNMQIPATLSLCKGLPVMIRFNGATELCITKGQEGTVHGWQAGKGRHGQLVLKVLYVKLEKPSTDVQFKDLPLNVVPITPNTRRINCKLPDDRIIQISRTQVEVLPNFAMTDFASQGKTRDPNIVDIYNSRDFRAIYTALSRSSSADGTIILQGFNVNHITGGVKDKGGYRQELRELEILNDITKLRENRKLPPSIIGDLRGSLIQQYRSHFGKSHTPDELHESLVWDTNEKFESTLHKDIHGKS